MSKTPLKQADQTLVSGAYRAASAGTRRDGFSQGMDELMNIGKDMVKGAVDRAQEAQQKGNELAEGILDIGGGLGTSWLKMVEGEVSGLHGDYKKAAKWGKKGKKAEGMQNLNTLSAEVASVKDLNTQIAKWQTEGDWNGSLSEKEQGVFNAFMNNNSNKRITKGPDGERVFEVETPQGWMSTKEIEKMAEEHKKDYVTATNLRKDLLKEINKGTTDAFRNAQYGYIAPDEKERISAQINKTLSKGNLKSLMFDDILDTGGSFVVDLANSPMLKELKYEDLGLVPPKNDDDGLINETLTEDDRMKITQALSDDKNKELGLKMMNEYVMRFYDKNYQAQYKANGGTTLDPNMSNDDIIKLALKE